MGLFCDENAMDLRAREWSFERGGEWAGLSGKTS